MPQYTYFCEPCGLQFKRRLSQPTEAFKCPACEKLASRDWAGQTIAHAFQETPGTQVGNSGVAKHDYPTADNLVGRDSERKWVEQHARNKAKASIRHEGVALARRDVVDNGQLVSEYKNLNKTEFDARKKLEKVFKKEIVERGATDPLK